MISFFLISLPIFAVIGVGWAATRTRLVAQGALDALNAFSFRFALPALLLRLIAGQPLRQSFNPEFYTGYLPQIVLVIVGLVNLALIYFLYMDLRHSSWLLERKNEVEPMFLSFFIPVGVFLLMAARRPSEHRSMIALAAWWNIAHGVVMAIQTVEARIHGVHRDLTDVVVFIVIGGVLLALLPAKREAVASGVA